MEQSVPPMSAPDLAASLAEAYERGSRHGTPALDAAPPDDGQRSTPTGEPSIEAQWRRAGSLHGAVDGRADPEGVAGLGSRLDAVEVELRRLADLVAALVAHLDPLAARPGEPGRDRG